LSHGAHLGDDHHQIHGSAELGHGADLALVPPCILSGYKLDLKKQRNKKQDQLKKRYEEERRRLKRVGEEAGNGLEKNGQVTRREEIMGSCFPF
jgi:hypothetical protein